MVDELAAVSEGLAEKGPEFERAIGEPAGVRNRPDPAAVEVAADDLLVGELDKDGHGSRVVIAKGDPIPPELRALPRRAAREAPRKQR
jgi:hypothetical protein